MRKWILFGALMLGLVQLEWGLERWASRAAPGSTGSSQLMENPYPLPTPVPTPSS
jgi:hypothetical protein